MTMLEAIEKTAYKFRDIAIAQAFIDRATRPMMGVLGNDGIIWVVEPAEAQRLERLGYELMP